MAHDVFISYSSKDKPAADAVCATLEARGIRCWIAPRDILPGMDWSGAIIDGISESRLLVLVFSSNSNDSPQIKREVERAVNKSLPILPFRIEDVALSKPLEYFISTPHWLDALTPPMENHLNYLAETVEVLLKRKTVEEIVPRLPVSKPKENSRLLWGAIVFAVIMIGSGAFVLSKIWPGTKQQAPTDTPPAPVPAPEESRLIEVAKNPEEPALEKAQESEQIKSNVPNLHPLAGLWHTNPTVDGKPWKLQLRIQRNGAFDFTGTTQDNGSYTGQNGRWQTHTLKGETDSGTYTFLNPNMVSITGKLGTGVWNRVRKRSAGAGSRVDPAMVSGWQTSAVIDGKEFTFLFDIHSAGTFQITTTTSDQGTIEAANGKFRQISKNGSIINGTYHILSPNSVTLASPAGAAVWTR